MSLLAVLKALHVLAVVLWVGGMAFAHFCLRPAVLVLEPPQRVRLLHAVLGRFLRIVLWSALLVLASGLRMIGRVARQAVQSGGVFAMPLDWSVMTVVGLVMVLIYGHIRWVLWRRLDRAMQAADVPAAAAAMAPLRQWMAVNLALGLALTAFVLAY
ncbi:MAG: CopD family protein [Rubrivivax sp.]|nr:CopD family protein [Rubrivivax sp.]